MKKGCEFCFYEHFSIDHFPKDAFVEQISPKYAVLGATGMNELRQSSRQLATCGQEIPGKCNLLTLSFFVIEYKIRISLRWVQHIGH